MSAPDAAGRARRPWRGEIVGHRGAAGLAPENTLEGFEAAIAAGAGRIEFDVRATSDGVVVFHDRGLERFVPGARFDRGVGRRSTAEMTALDVGAAFRRPGCRVPTLEATLDALQGRVALNVEVKGSGADGLRTLERTLAALAARRGRFDVIVSSFHEPVVSAAASRAPDVQRALVVGTRGPSAIAAARAASRLGCEGIHPHHGLVDAGLVAACSSLGLAVRAWTVNDEAEFLRLIALGVDGIVTDRPDALAALVSS